MIPLARFWCWWTESWRAPRRARWLYVVMAMGFGALALVATAAGNSAIAVIAGLAAIVTVILAVLAPWLSRWMNPPRDVG